MTKQDKINKKVDAYFIEHYNIVSTFINDNKGCLVKRKDLEFNEKYYFVHRDLIRPYDGYEYAFQEIEAKMLLQEDIAKRKWVMESFKFRCFFRSDWSDSNIHLYQGDINGKWEEYVLKTDPDYKMGGSYYIFKDPIKACEFIKSLICFKPQLTPARKCAKPYICAFTRVLSAFYQLVIYLYRF